VKTWFLGHFAWIFYRLLSWTWKLEIVEAPELKTALKNRRPFILAHWHGDELALIHFAGPYRIATMASKSKDGGIMAVVIQRLGGAVVRGSSSRGAISGYLGLIRLIKKSGYSCSFAVDGPKGPYHKAKPGALETSKNLQIPIFCSGISCEKAWVFTKAWNKALLPKPFSKVRIVWSGPFPIPQESDDVTSELWLTRLEKSLDVAKQQAQGFIADS